MGRCVVREWFLDGGKKKGGGGEGYRFNSGQGKFLCSIRNALLLGRGEGVFFFLFRGIWVRYGCMFVRTELCSDGV